MSKLGWQRASLGSLIDTQKGYAFKSGWYCETGRRIVKVSNFTEDSIESSGLTCIPESTAAEYLKYQLRVGDVIVQTVGSWPNNPASVVGKCVRTPSEVAGSLLNQNAVKLSPSTHLEKQFLFYLLRNEDFKTYIVGTAQGAASQAAITLEAIRGYEFNLPPLSVQQRIAGILSAYDEQIENSQRRINILESIARALYREWFVLFRFPGHENHPRVTSSLGEIPEGWEVKKLEQLASIKGGKQLEKEDINEAGEFPVFGGNGIQGYSERSTHQGFVIAFGRVGAYCGSIHWSYDGAWLNNNSSSVVPQNHDELVLHHLLDFNFTNLRGGAAQPFISNSALAGVDLLYPGDALAAKFCFLVKPLRLQQVTLEKAVQNLRRTRDLLLPRLLSGQINVEAA